MGKLFEELRRRKVFRVAAVYAVVAWLLIEVTSTILPTFDAPAWVNQTVTLLLILGFPITLIMAWAYEVTPEGIKPDFGTQAKAQVPAQQNQLLIYATFALVLLVAGFQFADLFMVDTESTQLTDLNTDERVRRSNLLLGPLNSVPGFPFRTSVALSPDGSRLAYTTSSEDQTQLHIRELDQLESRTLGTPFDFFSSEIAFSPDGEWLTYKDGRDLKKISVLGGAGQSIAEDVVANGPGHSWADDETIYLTTIGRDIVHVPASGGTAQPLNIPRISSNSSEGELLYWPSPLPGTSALLFTRFVAPGAVDETGIVELFDIATNESQLLIQNAYNATYSPSGHIAFMRSGSLWAVPFDLDSRRIIGAETLLIEGIDGVGALGFATYSFSRSGDLVYLPGKNTDISGLRQSILAWVDRRGEETALEMVPQSIATPRLSPDGSRVALSISSQGGNSEQNIWSYELDRGTFSRITFTTYAWYPLWSPDGSRLVYYTLGGISSVNSNGIGEIDVLVSKPDSDIFLWQPTSFTPDGTQLLYQEPSSGSWDMHSLSMAPEHVSTPLFNSGFEEQSGAISPNGRWIAYATNETGELEVYVRPFPDIESDKWLVSQDGGGDPQWAADTGELFYRKQLDGDEGIETYAVAVSSVGEFSANTPQLLFTSAHRYGETNSYSVAADGQRFMMLKPVADEDAGPVAVDTNLVLVENFAAELRRLAPPFPQ